ncbi:replication-relaxation family protein [Escherichia coli]|nr:replication-relaxation family protein [Escherichia coli]
MLYSTRDAIVERNAEKRRDTLTFLAEETCSTSSVIALLLNIKSVPRANDFLRSLEKQEIVCCSDTFIAGRKVRLWGLTEHGAALSGREKVQPFHPSRVSPTQLQHRLDIQRIRLMIQSHPAVSDWRYPSQRRKGERSHDAEFRLNERIIGLEVERTVKSRSRYEQIVSDFFVRIMRTKEEERANVPQYCWYVCPTEEIALRVGEALKRCTRINNNGKWESLPEAIIAEQRFKAFTYDAVEKWAKK